MRYILFTILIIFIFQPFNIFAQSNFETQGAQENYWATELFDSGYSKQDYQRFNGKITQLDNYLVKYDSTLLKLYSSNLDIKQIFVLGIFYPGIFNDPRIHDTSRKNISFTKPFVQNQKMPEYHRTSMITDTIEQKGIKNDTATISNIEELIFLSKSPKIRRFKMWVNRRPLINPVVYFIELTNTNAGKETDLLTFIKGSSLTFVREAWIII